MHANLPDIAKRWERDYAGGGIAELNQELNSLPAYYLPKNQGGRIGFDSVTNYKTRKELIEEADLDEARQLKNPKKEVLVVKSGKVTVIDKKDAKEYLNKVWDLAEEVNIDESARSDDMRAIRKDKDLGKRSDVEDNDSASDADIKGASKNIIMQMRKIFLF